MFALQNRNQIQVPTDGKLARDKSASEDKKSPRNNVWHSLAFRSGEIQPKLMVSRSDDPYEREADRVADRVMRMATGPNRSEELSFTASPSLKAQRKCDQCI